MTEDEELNAEMTSTSWQDSCQALYYLGQQCGRAADHDGAHCCGFLQYRVLWTD